VRFRTFTRHRAIARTKRNLIPVAIISALLAAGGISAGAAASAVEMTTSSPTLSAVVAPTVERDADQDAAFYVSVARAVEDHAAGKVDTSALDKHITELRDSSSMPVKSVRALTQLVREATGIVTAAAAEYDAQLAARAAAEAAAAQAAAAAAQAAAEAAAAQAAAEAAAWAAANANTPDGARATARAMAASSYGWGDGEFSCLDSLWQKESGWNYQAYNPSGATGIPQALPGSKMATAGSDWQTSATTQIAWGLGYIQAVYGSPCAAWGHSQSVNWY
jgi:hypothetical protein